MQRIKREFREWSGDCTTRFSCKTNSREFNTCGHCETCIYTAHLKESTQWISRARDTEKRRFLSGLLLRCRSLGIMENLQNVLQVTLGKDFTYSRSQVKAQNPEEVKDLDHNKGLTLMDTLDWFSRSPDWAKSNYLLGILSLCDTDLLHLLGNLVRVLIVREKQGFLPFRTVPSDPGDECCSESGSHYSFHTEDHPELDLLIQASSVYKPLHECFPQETKENIAAKIQHGSGPTNSAIWSELEETTFRGQRGKYNDTHSDTRSEDPALMVVPRASSSMSGVSLHRDFIRRLPVYIGKRILGLLDMATLQQCKRVSQHWRYLTEEILREIEVKKTVESQAMILQGSSSPGVNPVYARIRMVLVPLREEDKYIHPLKMSSKNKKDVEYFESVYAGVKTRSVEMEERNVFCGVFNILVLLDREDPSRVIHYSGGQMVAVGSKDRMVHLLDVTLLKEVPVLMQGHAGSVRAVLLSEERELVISASYDLSIRCWNLKTGVCTMLLWGHMGTISCLDLHEHLLVSGARDCRVKVWDLQTGQCCERLKFKHPKPIVCVKISASLVLSGCEGGLVKMWDTESADLLKVMEAHQGCVKCLFFDEWHILSGGSDGQVVAWSTNIDFKKSLMTFHHPKGVLTLSFLFLRVITGCVDGKIRIFNFLSGDCLRVIKISTHQSSVLSLHTHDNNLLVNSSSRVLLLKFAKESWDYSAVSERRSGPAVFQGTLHAEHKALLGSSKPKVLQWDGRARKQALSHVRSLSAPSRQRAHVIQHESMCPATWDELQASCQSHSRPLSAHSRASQTSRSTSTGSENLCADYVLTTSETAVQQRVKKRGVHHPVSAPQMLLKVRPSQQPHSCDLATTNMMLNVAVRDAWGLPPHDHVEEPQTKTSPPLKAPKRPHSAPKLSTQSCFKGTVTIYTPLTTRVLDMNIQHSLHSGRIDSPTLILPQTGLSSHEPLPHPKLKSSQKMLMRSMIKQPGGHVDSEMPRKPKTVHFPLDPFRERGGFQLKTDTELEEFIHAQLLHTPTHTTAEKEQQRKTAGKLKIKGVPVNNCKRT
ncbi:F-box and WD repeat domain containing protein 10B [Hoplias malabaricus]|uniref:F-box and WD repeat domain containing protein 10B n=1 Tax=Hoplias malabaricus TaxID=27720 RepID=UPI0034629268